jgi:hypothetical protein
MADTRIERAEQLQKAVNEWAINEITRLEDEATFLRSIQPSEKRIASQTSSVATQLAFNDVTDFIKT